MSPRLYALGGAAFAVLAFVAYLLWQLWGLSSALSASEIQLSQATSDRDQAIEVNRSNTQALATLAANEARNNALLLSIAGDLNKLNADMQTVKSNREKLAQANPDVKAFLDTPVPAAMRVRQPAN